MARYVNYNNVLNALMDVIIKQIRNFLWQFNCRSTCRSRHPFSGSRDTRPLHTSIFVIRWHLLWQTGGKKYISLLV